MDTIPDWPAERSDAYRRARGLACALLVALLLAAGAVGLAAAALRWAP